MFGYDGLTSDLKVQSRGGVFIMLVIVTCIVK